jgi:hypothetical protein
MATKIAPAALFVGTLVQDVDAADFQFAGDVGKRHECVSPSTVIEWWNTLPNGRVPTDRDGKPLPGEWPIGRSVCELKVPIFGKIVPKRVLFYESLPSSWTEVSGLQDTLRTYLKSGILPDGCWQVVRRVLEEFEPLTDGERVLLRRRKNAVPEFIKRVATVEADGVAMDAAPLSFIDDETDPKARYLNFLITLHEVSLGFYSFREHSVVNEDDKGNRNAQKFMVSQDLLVTVMGSQVIAATATDTLHRTKKTSKGWVVVLPDGTEVSTRDFKPVAVVSNPDGSKTVRLLGAYTHNLRNVLGFRPQMWQAKYLMNHRRLNAIAGVRRGGKTMLSSYCVLRRLFRNPQTGKHDYRQVKGLFIAPTEDKLKSVVDFITESSNRLQVLKIVKWVKSEDRFTMFDETLDRRGSIVSSPLGTYDFASDRGFEPGRGNGADEVLIDEAGFIQEDTYLTLVPILENEGATLMAISTIDWETPKHWFYGLIVDYEQGGDAQGYSQRVTLDDIDERLISSESKERMRKAFRDNPMRYYAELYATFPDAGDVFDPSKLFIIPHEIQERVHRVVIGYDPARRNDFGAATVGLDFGDRLELVEGIRMQGEYGMQRDRLIALKSKYRMKYGRTELVIDATAAGETVAELMGDLVDYRVWYTAASKSPKPEQDKFGVWHVSKGELVRMAQVLVDLKKIRAFSDIPEMLDEVKNFKRFGGKTGEGRYQAAKGHDDVVNSMMLCSFWYAFLHGQIHSAAYRGGVISGHRDPSTNLWRHENLGHIGPDVSAPRRNMFSY